MSIVLALGLTVFVYLIFPIIYRSVKGGVPKNKAKKMALINSAVCATLFIILYACTGVAITAYSFAPAVLYYFIAKAILVEHKKENNQ